MANWTRIRALWTNLTILGEDELTQIDDRITKTWNGDAGSTHAPTGPTQIGGAQLYTLACPVKLAGDATMDGDVTLSATATLTINAAIPVVIGGPVDLAGPTEVSGDLSVTGPATLDEVDINGPTSLDGPVTRTGALTVSGDAATTARRQKTIAVGNPSAINADVSADEWMLLGTFPATTMTVEVSSVTAPVPTAGQRLTIVRLAVGSGNASIEREDGSVIAVLPNATHSGVELSYWPANGGWRLMGGFAYNVGASP